MIATHQIAIGTKLEFIEDCDQYRKGAIIEVASYNRTPEGFAFSFHGISGHIWGYSKQRLTDLRRDYPHGNFSLPKTNLYAIDFLRTEWDT